MGTLGGLGGNGQVSRGFVLKPFARPADGELILLQREAHGIPRLADLRSTTAVLVNLFHVTSYTDAILPLAVGGELGKVADKACDQRIVRSQFPFENGNNVV